MKTLQYWGTGNFQEHPYTGRIVTWTEKEKQTVDDAIATKLLAANAGFVLDNDESGEVVTSQVNSVTGGIELRAADSVFDATPIAYDAKPIVSSSLVLDDLIATVPASQKTAITLPNPYSEQSNAPVHPSLLFFPTGWNGYRYWVAYTPYPGSVSDYENPCVAASNDLVGWVSPAPNPLVPKPTGTAYNADTHLVMSPDGETMYLLFRERGVAAKNNLKIMHTTDGVRWTSPVTVLTGDVGTTDFASPSAWWNGSAWVIVSHNADAVSPWPLQRRVSDTADIYGSYGSPTTVTPTPVAGRAFWHSFFVRLSSGQVCGILQDNSGTAGSTGDLYWAQSYDDGVTWQRGEQIDLPSGKYRSTFAVRGDEVDLLIGTLTSISLVRAKRGMIAQKDAYFYGQAALIASASNLPTNGVWADSFVRGDSAASLGTASSGGTYTASSGTWGISTNRAYPVTSGRVLAQINVPNHRVSVQFKDMTTGIQQWVIARAVDGSNYWRLGSTSPTASGYQTAALQEIVGGSIQTTYTVGNYSRGDTLAIECSGTTIKCLVNGVVTYELQSSLHMAGTQIGMQANAGANTFMKNLTATKV